MPSQRRVIGRMMPERTASLDPTFDRWIANQNDYNTRVGIIPAEVAPNRVRSILQNAARGNLGDLYELYRKMLATDSRYGGLAESLKSAVSGLPLKTVIPEGTTPSEKALAADYAAVIEENLCLLDTHALTRQFMDAYLHGTSVMEMRYALEEYPYGRRIAVVDRLRPVPGAALAMDMNQNSKTRGELLLKTEKFPSGRPLSAYRKGKFLVVQEGFPEGFYDAVGVARKCVSWWITKIYAQLWWTEFVEVYGQPLRIGFYPETAGTRARGQMEYFLKTLGKSAYGLFPQGMQLQLQQAQSSGTVTTYQDLIKMCNHEIAIALMGQVDTMGGSKEGSYAKTKVLDGVRHEILQHVIQVVRKGFDGLVEAIICANYGNVIVRRLFPRVAPLLVEPEDIEKKARVVISLQEKGTPISVEYIHDELGIPAPRLGEKVLIGGRITEYTDTLSEDDYKERQATAKENAQQETPATSDD